MLAEGQGVPARGRGLLLQECQAGHNLRVRALGRMTNAMGCRAVWEKDSIARVSFEELTMAPMGRFLMTPAVHASIMPKHGF